MSQASCDEHKPVKCALVSQAPEAIQILLDSVCQFEVYFSSETPDFNAKVSFLRWFYEVAVNF